ncbi:MAG: hypothetical protein HKL90_06760 [Elusimicrobia bacterium]|nr:hypothetical protein [Elusimicrobiota bacterium]
MRRESLLVLVLTRRCDRRCGFCPQEFSDADMAPDVLDAAISGLLPRLAARPRVKLFGGEPMLRPDLVARALDAVSRAAPRAVVELSTHGGALAAGPGPLAGRARLEVFASRPIPAAARLPGAVLNILLAPGESVVATVARVARGRAAGFRRFNFLPAYFTRWSAGELARLRERFAATRRILERLAERGDLVEVVNLCRASSTPLYNDGLVVDCDGEVYSSNVMLAAAVAPRKAELRLGHIGEPLEKAACATSADVVARSVPSDVLAATFAADALLSEFCRNMDAANLGRRAAGEAGAC